MRPLCSWCLDNCHTARRLIKWHYLVIDNVEYRLCPMCYYDLELNMMTSCRQLAQQSVETIRKRRARCA